MLSVTLIIFIFLIILLLLSTQLIKSFWGLVVQLCNFKTIDLKKKFGTWAGKRIG